jgi:hypothetical protein
MFIAAEAPAIRAVFERAGEWSAATGRAARPHSAWEPKQGLRMKIC